MRKVIKNICLVVAGYIVAFSVATLIVKLVTGRFMLTDIFAWSLFFYVYGLWGGAVINFDEKIEIRQKKVSRDVFLGVSISIIMLALVCLCTIYACCFSGWSSDEVVQRCSGPWGIMSGLLFGMLLSAARRSKQAKRNCKQNLTLLR